MHPEDEDFLKKMNVEFKSEMEEYMDNLSKDEDTVTGLTVTCPHLDKDGKIREFCQRLGYIHVLDQVQNIIHGAVASCHTTQPITAYEILDLSQTMNDTRRSNLDALRYLIDQDERL